MPVGVPVEAPPTGSVRPPLALRYALTPGTAIYPGEIRMDEKVIGYRVSYRSEAGRRSKYYRRRRLALTYARQLDEKWERREVEVIELRGTEHPIAWRREDVVAEAIERRKEGTAEETAAILATFPGSTATLAQLLEKVPTGRDVTRRHLLELLEGQRLEISFGGGRGRRTTYRLDPPKAPVRSS